MGEALEKLVWGVAAALVPSPIRDRILRERGVDGALWSVAFGMVEGAVGLGLYMFGYLVFIGGYTNEHQWLLLENWSPGLSNADMMYSGIFGFFAWHMFPQAWVFGYLALTGLIRCITFLAVREPMAEPIVALGLSLVGATRRRRRSRKHLKDLGVIRADRLIENPPGIGCDAMVVSSRDKPSWNERVTIGIGDKTYRLQGVEERWEGERKVVCFLLDEAEEHAVIRGFVSWDSDPLHPDNYRPGIDS